MSNFKVLLYTEMKKVLGESGLGKAIRHQERALKKNGISYTLNPREDFDVVHINFYGLKSRRMAKKAHRRGKKVVYHAHSTEEDFRNSFIFSNLVAPIFKRWLISCYRLGDIIITPTEYSRKLLERYGLENIRVVSNGVDIGFFKRSEEGARRFRERYGDDKIVVGIGLYLERKGILEFVELAKRMPEYQFVWFGSVNKLIIPRKVRKAVNTKLPNLQFPGHVPAEEIRDALSGADLFLFTSFEETEGIPVLEGLACETQMIIREIPVFSWLKDVHKAKDLDDFERKTRKILAGELLDLTKEGRKVAREYDEEVVGKKLVAVYREVLGETAEEGEGVGRKSRKCDQKMKEGESSKTKGEK